MGAAAFVGSPQRCQVFFAFPMFGAKPFENGSWVEAGSFFACFGFLASLLLRFCPLAIVAPFVPGIRG